MDDFSAHLKTVWRIAFFFLSILFMGWALLPAYRPYFAGLILGSGISMLNMRYLAWKIEQLTQAVMDKTNRKINMGFITRASTSLLAVLVSYRFPEQFAFWTTLAGLFFVQLATLLLGILSNLQRK